MNVNDRSTRLSLIWLVILCAASIVAGCAPYSGSTGERTVNPTNCQSLMRDIVASDRAGSTAHATNGQMESLRENCPSEFQDVTDYFSVVLMTADSGIRKCAAWRKRGVEEEAIDLLKEDGLCTTATKTKKKWPEGGLGWNKAAKHVGKVKRVCGPLKSARETEHGTFLNVGRDYPNAKRFTFVMWDIYLDPIVDGADICAKGEIYLYEGVAQMEVNSATSLEIWQ